MRKEAFHVSTLASTKRSFPGCSRQEFLLHDEVNKWNNYWDAMIERILSRAEIRQLREKAFRATKALKDHAVRCTVCSKAQKHRWYSPSR